MEDRKMKPESEKEWFLDKRKNVDRLLWGFTVLCALVLLVDFVFHRHVYHSWEEMWGFYGIFGFVGIWVLVQASKVLRWLVKRDEDHYESD